MSISVDTINLRFNVKPDYDQQQLQQLQDDLKNGQKELEKTRKEIDANTKEQGKLNEKLVEAKHRRDELANQKTRTEKENAELERLANKVDEYNQKIQESRNRGAELSRTYQQQTVSLQQAQRKMTAHVQQVGIGSMSIAQLTQRQRDLNAVLRQLNPKSEEFARYKGELDEVSARLKELRSTADQTKGSLGKWEKITGFLGKFNVFGFALSNLKGIITTVWQGVKTATAEWYNYNRQMAEATRLTREFLGLSGSDLHAMVADIKATADVWGKDYKQTLEAVDALTVLYGQDARQSLQDIRDGFQAGADLNGNMLDKLMRYGPAFRDAGIGARELLAIIQQTRSGIFSDAGLDLISMAGKRIREMSNTTRESLEAVGVDVGQMMAGLSDGSLTMFQAIRQVSGALKTVGENSQQAGEVLRDVFGRQGAAGGQEMIRSLEQMDTSLDNLIGTTGEYGRLQARQVETQAELNKRTQALFAMSEGGFDRMMASLREIGARLLIRIMDGLIQTANYLINLYNHSATLRVAWVTLTNTFSAAFMLIKDGFSVVGNAISAVVGLVSGAVVALEGLLTLDFTKAKQGVMDFGRAIGDFVTNTYRDFRDAGQKWGEGVNEDIRNFNRKVEPVRIPVTTETQDATATAAVGSSKRGSNGNRDGNDNSKSTTKSTATATPADDYRQQLAAREQAYREYGNSLRQMLLDQLLTEEEYQQESREAELKFLSDKAALQQQYGQDVTQTQQQYLDKMLQEANRRYQQQQEQLKKQQEQERRELERNRLSQEGNNDYLQKVEWQGQSFDRMRQLNDEYLQQNLISYQQYQQNLSDIAQQESDRRQQIEQAATDATRQLLQSSQQLFQAMQQRETAQVDAKYKRLIAAAKKQGKDTTRLEEQQEQEKAAIQKKYAEKQFMLNVLQIIASTATGIARLWKDLPFYAALPLTAVVAASGAAQLASAKMAADQASGLYRGGYSDDYADTTVPAASPAGVEGYTKKGDPRKQAGFIPVHQSEFVANHKAVANPAVRPVLDVIDRHQRMGDIQMLNATRLLEEAYGQGRYRGGYTRTAPDTLTPVPDDSPSGTAADRLLPILTRIEQNTARSLTVRSLRDEIAHEEQLEQNARR